jgi:NAD(P)-dependent dehydrogenase (short-subunit alcohol dehydrogenase family)
MPPPRIIVLTGATRGIGRALAAGFASAGHSVCGCGRSLAQVEELRDMLGAPHRFDVIDVTSHSAVDAWASEVFASHGTPDLLVNNAGLINQTAPLWEVSREEFDAVIGVNVTGVANVIRAFLRPMVSRGTGVVVNMSSGWGRSTSPEVAPYCASKYAVEGLTAALSEELPAGMAAVTVSPGTVDTDMLRSLGGEAAKQSPSPEEWAARGAPALLAISAKDNGQALTI